LDTFASAVFRLTGKALFLGIYVFSSFIFQCLGNLLNHYLACPAMIDMQFPKIQDSHLV